jgi:DNA sulfur modification protein DndE
LETDAGGQEFNRYTLTGQYDALFIALLKERMIKDGLDCDQDLFKFFRAHIENGIIMLYNRVKYLSDFIDLLPPQSAESENAGNGTKHSEQQA